MLYNYHTHTYRCNHAYGTEEEYILRALDAGFSELGFSDHAPYFFADRNYVSSFRMDTDQYHGYVQTLLELREKYKSRIQLHIGLEAEYYPGIFERNLRYWLSEPLDYLILGQHFTNNEEDGTYACSPSAMSESVLARYAEQVEEAVSTGLFTYIAHPDLIMYDRKKPEYRRHMRRICEAAKQADMPLEINLLGMERGRCYPNEDFFGLAAECGNKVIIGFDAHSADEIYSDMVTDAYRKAEDMCARFSLVRIERPELVRPHM